MKLLVTGGAGFIGSNFIAYMVQKYPEYEIVNVDALTYCGNADNLAVLEETARYRFVRGRIEDKSFIMDLFEKERFDIVVNFAAESHVDRSLTEPGRFLTTNVLGTESLLEASRKYGVKRYHQISTDEVYGDLPLHESAMKFSEDSPIRPSSPYAVSKASADLLTLAYHRSFGLPVTISRCSNNYGPYQFPEKFIPLMIGRAERNLKIPIYGDGQNVRDWLYVEDHCSAIDMILHQGRCGEIYNIGGCNEYSNLQTASVILEKLQKPESLLTFVRDRSGHDRRYAINPAKIESELGWRPSYTFAEGIDATLQWYRTHQAWLEERLNEEYQAYFAATYPGL